MVGQELADAHVVHQWLVVGVEDGGLHLMLANLLAHETGELVVDGMARTGGYDAALDGLADEGHVAHDVEQLMACALVLPHQRAVLYVAGLRGVHVGNVEQVGQLVEFLLGHYLLVDDDGVVQIAAFDEVGLQEGYDVAHEDKRACGSYLVGKLVGGIEGGELRGDELGVEVAHGCDGELAVGEYRDA